MKFYLLYLLSKGLNIIGRAESQPLVIAHSNNIVNFFYIYSAVVYTTPYQIVSFSSPLIDPFNFQLIYRQIFRKTLCIPHNW